MLRGNLHYLQAKYTTLASVSVLFYSSVTTVGYLSSFDWLSPMSCFLSKNLKLHLVELVRIEVVSDKSCCCCLPDTDGILSLVIGLEPIFC